MIKIKDKIITFVLTFLLFTTAFFTFPITNVAKADTNSGYSSVMDDLKKDSNFRAEDYPVMTLAYIDKVNNDTIDDNNQAHIEIISIAESSADELYIYTYQPVDAEVDLVATAILMSLEFTKDGQGLNAEVYDIELISSSAVFHKYVVKDFTVSNDTYRYYNIVTIYRDYNAQIDTVSGGSETDGYEIGIGVGQMWCVYYKNDTLVYEMSTFSYLDVNVNFTGNVEFSNGITMGNFIGDFKFGHLWFIAFDVEDYIIKRIFDADLSYKIRSAKYSWVVGSGEETTYGEWSDDIKVTLSESDTGSFSGEGLFGKDYTWNKISSGSSFLSSFKDQGMTFNDECKTALQNSQWVFAFAETEQKISSGSGYTRATYSDISDVTILRIHFMDIHGDVYNLGVVSDRTNPDDKDDGEDDGFLGIGDSLPDIFKILFALICVVLLFAIISSTGILELIIKAFIWVISIPFKLIKALFSKKE